MTRIESDQVEMAVSAARVYKYLSNFNNFKDLMPEQVINWTSTEDECAFTIKGLASLGMKYSSKEAGSEIKIINSGKAPFDFELICYVKEKDSNSCFVQLAFNAELNPFMKMMAEKPLKNFLNMLVNKLKDLNIPA